MFVFLLLSLKCEHVGDELVLGQGCVISIFTNCKRALHVYCLQTFECMSACWAIKV